MAEFNTPLNPNEDKSSMDYSKGPSAVNFGKDSDIPEDMSTLKKMGYKTTAEMSEGCMNPVKPGPSGAAEAVA